MRDERAGCLWYKKKTKCGQWTKQYFHFCHNLPHCQSGSIGIKFRIRVKHVLTCCHFNFFPSWTLFLPVFAFYAFVCPLVFPSPLPICSWHQRQSLISTLSYLLTICCVHLEELKRSYAYYRHTRTHKLTKKEKEKRSRFLLTYPRDSSRRGIHHSSSEVAVVSELNPKHTSSLESVSDPLCSCLWPGATHSRGCTYSSPGLWLLFHSVWLVRMTSVGQECLPKFLPLAGFSSQSRADRAGLTARTVSGKGAGVITHVHTHTHTHTLAHAFLGLPRFCECNLIHGWNLKWKHCCHFCLLPPGLNKYLSLLQQWWDKCCDWQAASASLACGNLALGVWRTSGDTDKITDIVVEETTRWAGGKFSEVP